MLGTILGFSIKEFLIPGARKHTHVPSQVTTGASLFRSGTYRTWKDKVHGIGFSRKVSPGSEETRPFYKKRLQLRGARNVSPFGSCIPTACATHVLEQTWWCSGSICSQRVPAWFNQS